MNTRNESNNEVSASDLAVKAVSKSAKWRKALVPLTTLAAAGALAVGSGADFTSATANPNSIVASGTLTQSNSKANTGVFNISNVKPGDVVGGEVLITNTGSLPAVMSLSETLGTNTFVPVVANTPASGATNLTLVVTEGSNEIYNGKFGAMGTKDLGTFTAGQAKTYKFTVTFAQSAGNEEQGKTATAAYTWNGAQTAPVTVNQGPSAATQNPTAAQ